MVSPVWLSGCEKCSIGDFLDLVRTGYLRVSWNDCDFECACFRTAAYSLEVVLDDVWKDEDGIIWSVLAMVSSFEG